MELEPYGPALPPRSTQKPHSERVVHSDADLDHLEQCSDSKYYQARPKHKKHSDKRKHKSKPIHKSQSSTEEDESSAHIQGFTQSQPKVPPEPQPQASSDPTANYYKVGQPCFEDKLQELNTDFAKICISPKPSGAPGPGFTKILKLKFMLKLTYKLIFMSLCSNSNFSHYRKFLNSNSPINSDIISLSEMLKFTFVGIFENSQAEIMLKLN